MAGFEDYGMSDPMSNNMNGVAPGYSPAIASGFSANPATASAPAATSSAGGGIGQALGMAAGGILGSLPAIYGGWRQWKAAKEGLSRLNKTPRPQYTIAPEMNVMQNSYNNALGRANQGFTDSQNAAFDQSINRANNTAYQNAVNMSGGNMANVMRGALNAQNLNAFNAHSAQDADLQLRKQQYADALGSQYARAFQNQRNLISQDEISDRTRREQALGKAFQDGRMNMINGASQGATALGNAAGMFLGSKIGS